MVNPRHTPLYQERNKGKPSRCVWLSRPVDHVFTPKDPLFLIHHPSPIPHLPVAPVNAVFIHEERNGACCIGICLRCSKIKTGIHRYAYGESLSLCLQNVVCGSAKHHFGGSSKQASLPTYHLPKLRTNSRWNLKKLINPSNSKRAGE